MLLFLDFDGVLHPVLGPLEMHVCRLSVLESVLRQAPQVRIVISSTWRLFFGMSELRAVVSADIAARIVGATPPPDDEPRHAEIMRYLKQHATHATEWVAVDDAVEEFPRGCPYLIRCDARSGLTDTVARELGTRLAQTHDSRMTVVDLPAAEPTGR
jgi:hypothetical protein